MASEAKQRSNKRSKGYVGQRKRDGKWFARVQFGGKDRTKFADSEESAHRLLAEMLAESPPQAIISLPVNGNSPANP